MSSETHEREEADETEPPMTKRQDLLIRFLSAAFVAGLLTSIFFGSIILFDVPWGAVNEPLEETTEIGQGHYERWSFEVSDYRIHYTAKVVQGGKVDVYATAWGWKDYHLKEYLLGEHSHIGVTEAEGTHNPDDDMKTFYLIVDNSNNTGIPSVGNVTVKIKIENTWLFSTTEVCSMWVIVFTVIVAAVMWRIGRKKDKAETTEESDRNAEVPPSPEGTDHPPTGNVCQECGGEYLIDEDSGWPYCPNCNRWAEEMSEGPVP